MSAFFFVDNLAPRMSETRRVLAEGNRTRIELVVRSPSERFIEKSLLSFANVSPERIRLAREARLGRIIADPGIAGTLGGTEDPHELSSFRREFLDGPTLAEALPAIAAEEATNILRNTVKIVARLHDDRRQGGLVHGDLTLTNLYRMSDGSIRLTDLELARFDDEPGDDSFGTPSMLAPEVRSGAFPSKASDVHQLGLVYLRLARLTPKSVRRTIWEHVLAGSPASRPSAQELLAALER